MSIGRLGLHDHIDFVFYFLDRLLRFLSFIAGNNWRDNHAMRLNFGVRLTER